MALRVSGPIMDAAYLAYPDGSIHKMNVVDDDLQAFKAKMEAAWAEDHESLADDQAAQHKKGTAAIYVEELEATILASDEDEKRWVLAWAEDTSHFWLSHDIAVADTFVWTDLGHSSGGNHYTELATASTADQQLPADDANPTIITGLTKTVTIPDDGQTYEAIVTASVRCFTDKRELGAVIQETEDFGGGGPVVTERDSNGTSTDGGLDFDCFTLEWVNPSLTGGVDYKFEILGWAEVASTAAVVNPTSSFGTLRVHYSKMKVEIRPRRT